VPHELPARADAEGPRSNGLTKTSAAVTTWQYHSSSCSLLRCIRLNNKNSPTRKAFFFFLSPLSFPAESVPQLGSHWSLTDSNASAMGSQPRAIISQFQQSGSCLSQTHYRKAGYRIIIWGDGMGHRIKKTKQRRGPLQPALPPEPAHRKTATLHLPCCGKSSVY